MAFLLVTQQPGLDSIDYCLLSGDGERRTDSDHGARHQVLIAGLRDRSGVVTTGGKFILRSGYVQIKAKMSDASLGGWPAIWFIDPNSGGGSQEIDLQEGGFTPTDAGLPRALQRTTSSCRRTTHRATVNRTSVTPRPSR